jgi:hypothetical protein
MSQKTEIVWQAEDSLREKKVESDLGDLLKTLVAFANSVAPGDTAQMFIGEKDDGTVQGVSNTDSIQKSVKKEADKIYPEIYYRTEVYEREGQKCVRVDIKHNGLAPHFGGMAWVRRGSVTVRATEDVYQQILELRLAKTRELTGWLNEPVTVSWSNQQHGVTGPNWFAVPCKLVQVTGYFSTFQSSSGNQHSEPNDWLFLSWDDRQNHLHVYVSPDMRSRPPW